MMLCYWGAPVREGLGLLQPGNVKHADSGGIRVMCPTSEIQDISAGKRFIGIIRDGKVSILKLRTEDNGHDGRLKQLQLKNDKIRSIVCGGAGAVLLDYGGKVLIMDNSSMCTPLKGLDNRQVIQIACGDQHSMALTDDGQLFVWGENSHGQLGLKEGRSGSLTAQHVQSLSGIPLVQISAGGDHSFALSLSGAVFGWGKNNAGQLGLGDTTDRHVPTVVNSLNQKKTVFISCGGEHTATLSKGGTVFTFGSGRFGQLGHNSITDEHHPRVIAELWGSKVSRITCGRHHTLVLVESSKLIYSFGCGTQGQLGNGQMSNQSVPLPVELPTEPNHAYAVEKLIAGENHSFALCFKELGNDTATPKPSPSRDILILDDRMIERWVSESDPKSWATIKNEINKVFSSAASLNGSFLKSNCDEHYQLSVERCALDFDLTKQSFAKLSENKMVMSEVVCVIRHTLLPSLDNNPVGVEALRLYLLLPELIKVLQKRRTELTEELASKILCLNLAALKVLENYWSSLPDDYLKCLVELFRKESAKMIDKICLGETNITKGLQKCLQVLQMLYKVYCSTYNDMITNRDFIIHEINDLLDTLKTAEEELLKAFWCLDEDINEIKKQRDYYIGTLKMLVSFPFVAETVSKLKIFTYLQKTFLQNNSDLDWFMPCFQSNMLHINRQSLLKDTLLYLEQGLHSFPHLLQVTFVGENGVDWRGLSAEFFSILSRSILTWDQRLLKVCENSLAWFNPDCTHKKDFYYIGIICGMALYNNHYMNINFPLALFKKLLQLSPTLNDLEELSPVEARGLKNLLEEDEEVVDVFFLDFTVKGQELIPNGSQTPVTKINREKYVELYVDFVFNKSVKNQFEPFSRGFFKGCPVNAWKIFHPEELRDLFHGSREYEWKDLRQGATYKHCSPSDALIKNFWTVFFELSEENKMKFLLFVYGTDRVPAGGLSKLALLIVQLNLPDPDDCLPEAQTCFGILRLPKYSNIDTLRDKLMHAINFCKDFGRM